PVFDSPASKVSELKLKQSQFRSDSSLAWKDKRRLLSISKMLQLQAEEAKRTDDPRKRNLDQMNWRVDSSGNVLYTLKNGSMVKDNGDKIFFSVNDPGAVQVAQGFARMMFGRNVKV
ncbi:relaxase, partial [Marinifilum sp. JC120]